MKIRTCAALLLAVLMIPLLTGCSLRAIDEGLDTVEDAVEHRVDTAEDAVESAVMDVIIPDSPPPLAQAPAPTASATDAATTLLTKEEAEAIALAYLNLTADQVSYLWTEYEIDDGIAQYDVQFHEGYWEYEFEIHAETGKILSFDKDD